MNKIKRKERCNLKPFSTLDSVLVKGTFGFLPGKGGNWERGWWLIGNLTCSGKDHKYSNRF